MSAGPRVQEEHLWHGKKAHQKGKVSGDLGLGLQLEGARQKVKADETSEEKRANAEEWSQADDTKDRGSAWT